MTEKRFRTGKGILEEGYPSEAIIDNKTGKIYYKGYAYYKSSKEICELLNELSEENQQLKAQLYCDDEEGVCHICKHHYLVKDNETELGYYNSRCKKGHYECARVSLKYCEDFEKRLGE